MSLGNLVAVVFGLAFGGALLMLSPAKAGAAMVGLAAAVTILRFPFWGLLLFALVATFMPYSTVNVGIRSTVSEAILALTWGAVLWHIFLSRLPPAPALRYRSTERMLLWLMLFTVLPFVVGQVSIKAEASGLSNWLRWLLNLSIVFLAGRLLVERKNRETLVIALLLGTLAMLLMSIAVFIRYRSASGMAPILAMFNYANLDTLKFGLEALSSRMGSPWMHPNATGGIMALLLPLAFCYGVANQGWRRGLGLAVAVLGAAAILLASSRGAMLSLAVVLFWMSLRKVPYTGRLLRRHAAVHRGDLALVARSPSGERPDPPDPRQRDLAGQYGRHPGGAGQRPVRPLLQLRRGDDRPVLAAGRDQPAGSPPAVPGTPAATAGGGLS
ncbi:hypothetical protein PALA53_02817 [Pseudomonas aeruginosa]|nr:hypothetical protein PALA53_02817 [Pseudomonas aeruginosa]